MRKELYKLADKYNIDKGNSILDLILNIDIHINHLNEKIVYKDIEITDMDNLITDKGLTDE